MDTRLNRLKEKPVVVTVALLLCIALVVTLSVPVFYNRLTRDRSSYFEQDYMVNSTYISTQVLYWDAMSRTGASSPLDLFFPGITSASQAGAHTGPSDVSASSEEPPAQPVADDPAASPAVSPPAPNSPPDGADSQPPEDGVLVDDPAPLDGDAEGEDVPPDGNREPDGYNEPDNNGYTPPELDANERQDLERTVLSIMEAWRNSHYSGWGALPYAVVDETGEFLSGNASLLGMLRGGTEDYADHYGYWVVVQFDKYGNISTPVVEGASSVALNNAFGAHDGFYYWESDLNGYGAYEYIDMLRQHFRPVTNMTFIFAMPYSTGSYNLLIDGRDNYGYHDFRNSGFDSLYYLAIAMAAVLSFATGRRILEAFPLRRVLYFEVCIALAIACLSCIDLFTNMGLGAMRQNVEIVSSVFLVSGRPATFMGLGLFFLLLSLVLGLAYIAALFLADIRSQGLRPYIYDRLLTLAILRTFYRWVGQVDLSSPGNKSIVKILAINYIILVVLSGFSPFGMIGFFIYSLVLFFTLRRFLRELSASYRAVLRATDEMAEGRLDAVIEEDLGVFDQLGTALGRVQQGFRRAVEAETQSQKMRTDLITNVSHDLKTPLTGIITYVNLLKDENLTAEDRASYVRTLDLKSQRLRLLIEDLFEISRVNSGNVTIQKSRLDLPALIRQVLAECEDAIAAADIELRPHLPEGHIFIDLDGEKTSRIFQNLIINVTKYAMPGTRAYIDLRDEEDALFVAVKNISREALDFDPAYITERFVRGDSSRGTEGSGLGLAIARSFAELQGGDLTITFDGDLFKVTVRFPKVPEADLLEAETPEE